MKTDIEMAREAGIRDCTCDGTRGCLERFAALVRADAFEQGRQEGMKQERALWTLTKIGQEIEAQPEEQQSCDKQEPLAWITPDGEGFRIRFSPPTSDLPLGWDALYTAQPQRPWVGLTKEEIDSALSKYQNWYEFAQHLENILRKKNA